MLNGLSNKSTSVLSRAEEKTGASNGQLQNRGRENMRPKKTTSKSQKCYLNLLKDERAHDEKELCTTPRLSIAFWHWVEQIQNFLLFHASSRKIFTFGIFRVNVLAADATWRGDNVEEGKRTDGLMAFVFLLSSLCWCWSLLVTRSHTGQAQAGCSAVI